MTLSEVSATIDKVWFTVMTTTQHRDLLSYYRDKKDEWQKNFNDTAKVCYELEQACKMEESSKTMVAYKQRVIGEADVIYHTLRILFPELVKGDESHDSRTVTNDP